MNGAELWFGLVSMAFCRRQDWSCSLNNGKDLDRQYWRMGMRRVMLGVGGACVYKGDPVSYKSGSSAGYE